jgi:hypothetical protein
VRDIAVCAVSETGADAAGAGDADAADAGTGAEAAEEPSAPEAAPRANSAETTLIVIAPAVATAVFLSIVCSSFRVPNGNRCDCVAPHNRLPMKLAEPPE